jgi:hypothetical protein
MPLQTLAQQKSIDRNEDGKGTPCPPSSLLTHSFHLYFNGIFSLKPLTYHVFGQWFALLFTGFEVH